jgi:hypothetical protein
LGHEGALGVPSALRASVDGSVVEISTRGARTYAMFCHATIVVVVVLLASSFTDRSDSSTTVMWAVLWALPAFAVAVWLFWRSARLLVSFGPGGVLVRNWYRTYRIAWSDVVQFADGTVSAGEGGPVWALAIRMRTSDRRLGCRATSMARKVEQPAIVAAIHFVARQNDIAATCEGLRNELPVVSNPLLSGGAGDEVRSARVPIARRGYSRNQVILFFDAAAAALDRGIRPARRETAFTRSFRGFDRSRIDELADRIRSETAVTSARDAVSAQSSASLPAWRPSDYSSPRTRPPLAGFALMSLLALAGAGIAVVAANPPSRAAANGYITGRHEIWFTARDARFRALFPTKPTRTETSQHDPGSTIVYTSSDADDSYGVWSVPWSGPPPDLGALVRDATVSTDHVVASHAMEFKGAPAYEQISLDPGLHLYDEQVDFVAADRLYRIDVSGTENPPTGSDRFIASVRVVP